MAAGNASRTSWVAGAGSIVVIVGLAGLILSFEPASSSAADVLWIVGLTLLGAVGTLLATRVPSNPIGWTFLAVSAFTVGMAWLGRAPVDQGLVEWLGHWTWIPTVTIPTTVCLLLFPDGRLPSPAWRPVAWSAIVGIPAYVVFTAFGPYLGGSPEYGPNPHHVPGLAAVSGWLSVLLPVAVVGSVAGIVSRFRRSRGTERQQMKWVAFGGSTAFVAIVGTFSLTTYMTVPDGISNAVVLFGVLMIPVSVAIAILRHRLYAIDRIISRTVAYSLVLAFVAGAYATVAIAAATVAGPDQPISVALATLAATAVFNPIRRRIQIAVDRRFNRTKYDAESTLTVVTSRIRDQVDLESLITEVAEVVGSTFEPRGLSLWLAESGAR